MPEPVNLLGKLEDFRFADFRSCFDAVDAAGPGTNVVALVGHSSLRAVAMRDLERPATAAELKAMPGILDDAMRAGAAGRFGIGGRGELAGGNYADIVVFDPLETDRRRSGIGRRHWYQSPAWRRLASARIPASISSSDLGAP